VDGRGRTKTQTTPGNNNGQNAPPFTTQFGAAPTGNVSPPTDEASGVPEAVLAVAPRSVSYGFHPSGNRTTATVDGVVTTYTYNAANQLISESSTAKTVTHQYDQWGNETVRVTTPAGQSAITETYGYNHLNKMSSYTNSATGANWQYDFYPTGERYAKTNLSTNTSELYVPRFDDVATEYQKVGASPATLQNRYVQGLGIDQKQLRIALDGTRRHLLGDQVGTIGMTLDDTGAKVDTSVKDAWGVQVAGSTTERYGGVAQREIDTESALVHMRHRMYDPLLGRFTQTDPILGNRPTDHYAYASNNPISRIDPRGLQDGTHIMRLGKDGRWGTQPATTEEKVEKDIETLQAWRRLTGDPQGWLQARVWRREGALESFRKGNEEALQKYETNPVEWVLAVQAPRLAEGAAAVNASRFSSPEAIRPGERSRWGAGVRLKPEVEPVGQGTGAARTNDPTVFESRIPIPPSAGGGAKVENLPANVRTKIQEFADRHKVTVTVVGSRAGGTSNPFSDYDYIIEGNARARAAAFKELPRGQGGGVRGSMGEESGIDVWSERMRSVDYERPHVIFSPGGSP
jgi:RHS repeat-associated protein